MKYIVEFKWNAPISDEIGEDRWRIYGEQFYETPEEALKWADKLNNQLKVTTRITKIKFIQTITVTKTV